jgi:hypothetical protein
MGMTVKRKWGCALAGALACCLVAGSARSAIVAGTDFHGRPSLVRNAGGVIDDTRHGKGWRSARIGGSDVSGGSLVVDLKASGLKLDRGAFEFTLVRGNERDEEAVFTLLGKDDADPLFILSLGWTPDDTEILSGGLLTNETAFLKAEAKGDMWEMLSPRVTVPGHITQGQKFRLTVTWGPAPSDNRLFLNGVGIKARLSRDFDLAGIVKRSTKLVIGEEIGSPIDGKHGGYHSQLASTLIDFKLLDTPTGVEQEPIGIANVTNSVFKSAGFSGKLIAGDKTQVEMQGTTGAIASFDVARLVGFDRNIALSWKGYGVYLEDKPFLDADEVDLHEVDGYQVFVSKQPFTAVTAEMTPVATLKVGEQTYVIENLELDVPYYAGVYAAMRDGSLRPVIEPRVNLPMTETAPGMYSGEFAVGPRESYPNAVIVGHLARGNESASLSEGKPFVIDTALTLLVNATPEELKADEESTAKVTVTVTDANGNPVAGHKVKFVLVTTSQYTGVVGGGAFREQVGGSIKESSWGETDLFGKVTSTYIAGFAAKTAIIVARDMVSNSTGTAAVKTFIQVNAQLTLVDPEPSQAAAAGYEIVVKARDAWLTADGKSQTRVTATVTLAGKPVEGHKVNFRVSGVGSVRAVNDTTNRSGDATAIYTAGKKIGIDVVSAEDVTVGISGSVAIELRSDAPAKINIEIKPDTLPADGRSTADLLVQVTDINDNPNDGAEVEYLVVKGSGRLREDKDITDRNGRSRNEFVAGRTPGVVTFELTVRSTVPTPEEFAQAENLALLPSDTEYY